MTTPLRLTLSSFSFHPVYSGPALRFQRYLPGFQARSVQTEVFSATPTPSELATSGFTPDWQAVPVGDLLPVRTIHEAAVYCLRLPDEDSDRRIDLYFQQLLAHCRQPGHQPQVLQLLSVPIKATKWLRRLRKQGIPCVFTHTLLAERSSRPWKRFLQRYYWRLPLQQVDVVVVSSSVMRDRLRQELKLRTRIEMIANGIDVEKFYPAETADEQVARTTLRRDLNIPEMAPVVIMVGPITPRKRTDLLLAAWQEVALKLPEVHLLLVGPRHDQAYAHFADFRQRVSDLAAAAGPERIHFAGRVADVDNYLRAADLFVFTSRREGMPNVIPEAMASCLPVITTPFVGLPAEFGQPGKEFVLVDPVARPLADNIITLLTNRERREAVAQNGYNWIRQTMSVATSLDKYVALYQEMAA